ncbi:MAG: FAD:protein FMN transferase [Armatimonadota bacterium]|nr:FAD:protein FMN transferase [Armatimonadota bacterium]
MLDIAFEAMACEFRMLIWHPDEYYARQVAELALDEISRLEKKLNCFDPASEVSYLNTWGYARDVIVSPELFEVLQLAKQVHEETGGAFDVTVGATVNLWRSAERLRSEPDLTAVKQAAEKTGSGFIKLNPANNSVRFAREGLLINLGAIGKGYAVRKAAQILSQYGISSGLISSGNSTVYTLGRRPDGRPWRVGIRHPRYTNDRLTTVELEEQALSTSGGLRQRDLNVVELYEHIIDPSTGKPARTDLVSASVLAADPAVADALSTAFYLGGKALAEKYCRSHEGVEAILVEEHEMGEYTFCHLGG